jgi:hypothetical protein
MHRSTATIANLQSWLPVAQSGSSSQETIQSSGSKRRSGRCVALFCANFTIHPPIAGRRRNVAFPKHPTLRDYGDLRDSGMDKFEPGRGSFAIVPRIGHESNLGAIVRVAGHKQRSKSLGCRDFNNGFERFC